MCIWETVARQDKVYSSGERFADRCEVTQMTQRKVLADGTKVPDKRLRKFLLDLANAQLTDAEDHTGTIFHLYSEFLPYAPLSPQEAQQNFPLLMALMSRWKKFDPHCLPDGREPYQRGIVAEMRERLWSV